MARAAWNRTREEKVRTPLSRFTDLVVQFASRGILINSPTVKLRRSRSHESMKMLRSCTGLLGNKERNIVPKRAQCTEIEMQSQTTQDSVSRSRSGLGGNELVRPTKGNHWPVVVLDIINV
eukprot:2038528-Amphidinium_carterae.1